MRHLLLFAGLHLATSTALAAQGQNYSQQFEGSEIHKLTVQSAGGSVRVHAMREDGAKVKGQRTMGDASCALTARKIKGSVDVVAADAQGAPCRIDVDIAINPKAEVNIVSEEGNVYVSGMRNSLSLKMTRGNAVVGGSFPSLSAHLTHGSLSAQGVGAQATLTLEEGNAQLWLEPSRSGNTVELDVGTGNVTLTAPGKDIAIDVGVPQGAIRNALNDKADAAIKVHGQINSGSLNIKAGPSAKG